MLNVGSYAQLCNIPSTCKLFYSSSLSHVAVKRSIHLRSAGLRRIDRLKRWHSMHGQTDKQTDRDAFLGCHIACGCVDILCRFLVSPIIRSRTHFLFFAQ